MAQPKVVGARTSTTAAFAAVFAAVALAWTGSRAFVSSAAAGAALLRGTNALALRAPAVAEATSSVTGMSPTVAGVASTAALVALCFAGASRAAQTKLGRKSRIAARFFGGGRAPVPEDVSTKTFFDISIGGEPAGRIVFGMYGKVVPKTVNNFVELCKAAPREGFKGSGFHRIIPQFMCQGGDFTFGNGTGGRSIYGNKFEDENFDLDHTRPGLLSMANSGPNTNGSQFFITTAVTDWLNGKHVVFGEVQEGYDVVQKMENVGSGNGRTMTEVVITDCGELALE